MSDDFRWNADNEDVLLPEQLATAIYENAAGGIVIRQEGQQGEDDVYVVIRPEYLMRVIDRLKTFLPLSEGP
jgi:hypothetical protein